MAHEEKKRSGISLTKTHKTVKSYDDDKVCDEILCLSECFCRNSSIDSRSIKIKNSFSSSMTMKILEILKLSVNYHMSGADNTIITPK